MCYPNFQFYGEMKRLKECFVVLDRIDVSSYREVPRNVARESHAGATEPNSFNRSNSMEIEHEVDSVRERIAEATEPESSNEISMAIDYEVDSENETAAAEYVLFASCYLLAKKRGDNGKKRNPRKVWVREWLQKRPQEGAYNKLLVELRSGDSGEQRLYRDFLRMTHENFEYLLQLVKPLIRRSNTQFRESISAGERLALTLHYLATGSSFRSLQYVFRIPQSTISVIIPAVLDAIWTVLEDEFVRVRFQSIFSTFHSHFNTMFSCLGTFFGK